MTTPRQSGTRERLGLLVRTVAHLPPAQVGHRIAVRSRQRIDARLGPERVAAQARRAVAPTGTAGWPTSFIPHGRSHALAAPSPEDNARGCFVLAGARYDLGHPIDWYPASVPRLGLFELHYWEWAWALGTHADRRWAEDTFARMYRSWKIGTACGRGDAWSPYVVAVRAWALCDLFDALARGTDLADEVLDDLVVHAGFLRHHLELDIGGNHLLKDLKALVGLGCFLGDDALATWAASAVDRQARVQVLADGGHYERSASYHVQVLSDLADLQALLSATGRPVSPTLAGAVVAMRSWLGSMRRPDGRVPSVNDTFAVSPAAIDGLVPIPDHARLTSLAASGYVVARPGPRLHLVADVGDPCPPELPGHAHADTLSFELCVDGTPTIVDVGTSTYDAGPIRSFERSTASHNTLTLDQQSSTEVWSAFRAARLAHASLEATHDDGATSTIAASHDGYRHLPGHPRHRRTFVVTESTVEITDEVDGTGVHHIRLAFHLAPGVEVTPTPDSAGVDCGPLALACRNEHDDPLALMVEPVEVATGFQQRIEGTVVHTELDASLPAAVRTTITLR